MSDQNLVNFKPESTSYTTPSTGLVNFTMESSPYTTLPSELVNFTTEPSPFDNISSSTLPIDMVFNDGHRVVIIVNSILIVVSSIGNFTVLILLIRRRLKNPSRIDAMLMHLSLADLIVTFLNMPLEIGWAVTVAWTAGDAMCRLMAFFRTFGLYLSSNVLVCISIDRYFAVIKPMSLAGMDRRGKVMLVLAWTAACVFSIPQAIIFHLENHPQFIWYEQCVTFFFFKEDWHEIVYSLFGMIFMYTLPLIIITFCYASIYIELYRKSRKSTTERFRRSNDDVLSRAKKKTLWMTITIVLCFVICWTPFYFMSVWYWLDKHVAQTVQQPIQKGLFIFAYTNSTINPIVYGLFNIPRRASDKRTSSHRHLSISKRLENLNDRRNSTMSNRTNSTQMTTIFAESPLSC
ncbi:gonadotropin-releasing hormone receptor isoform X2 [Bradysia coprophila]|uniref:gonadotropin-releasing hormone receptor isoform X2 n=1 Tax=Bradysia coprophila TaxID=38358 RepID=UPI00187D9BC2|nr:gonadotropin-releasing hormone receptor isoform X2 [Bradysia coprophila]XP_037024500.1 gonadotropin-releasing hormone receptor isoform X2 [Bradysia coprophila]